MFETLVKLLDSLDGENFHERDVYHDTGSDGQTGGQEEILGRPCVRHDIGQGGSDRRAVTCSEDKAEAQADVAIGLG